MKYSAHKLINDLLSELNERQREVLTGRFGLGKSGRMETLAALGARYRVTRERVRQIEASALLLLKKHIAQNSGWQEILERGKKELKEVGGVLETGELLKILREYVEDLNQNQLALILESSRSFFFYPEDKEHWHFYALDKNSYKNATALVEKWISLLRSRKEHVLAGKYENLWNEFVAKREMKPHHAHNHVSISKKIHRNPYGDVGLTEWSEILPRTIRERVYLILRKKKEPMHFRNITKAINEIFKNRSQASAPTVHNELIKDERFVLVGRGIYALREHGYEPGTAKEVIARILKQQGSLRPKDVILAVQKERFFKPNTVLVNLQNRNYFIRKKDGTYVVREA
ncbi:MAG: sigma factor-like helix-turn-helix DNA-binding protein [Candidatus Liptonbacteria bacterium]